MDEKIYRVICLDPQTDPAAIDWTTVPVARIDTYKWLDGNYEPAAQGQLVLIPGRAFVLRMCCAESSPKVVYHKYNEPVYTDSCLEFFAAWCAGAGDDRYMNMEMNAAGTLLSCLGAGRENRMPVKDLTGGTIPAVKGAITPSAWSVTAVIPVELLAKLYHVSPDMFGSGKSFRGNFYKCGDETPIPHYGMWNPVGTEMPDFHRPEYFGTFVIE